MSYIEKEKLIKADIASIEDRVRHAFNQGYDLGFKEGKEKARPQEQESILDEIRDKIQAIYIGNRNGYGIMADVLKIIDKYRTESEE